MQDFVICLLVLGITSEISGASLRQIDMQCLHVNSGAFIFWMVLGPSVGSSHACPRHSASVIWARHAVH